MNTADRPQLSLSTAHTYLIVGLGTSLYGIDSLAVEEVLLLPELTPVTAAPRAVIGVVNRRGALLPVIDLHLRFGYQPLPYRLTDSIVILSWQQQLFGALVNQVHDVRPIAPTAIERPPQSDTKAFSPGLARSGEGIIVLLATEALVTREQSPAGAWVEGSGPESTAADLAAQRRFFPEATPAERETLRARAARLRQASAHQDTQDFLPLAALQLGDEVFAIDLRLVREFAELSAIAPVPCCPSYIVGNANLRGEIVTLIDISPWLQLPLQQHPPVASVAIVQVGELVVGLLVEAVLDVLLLDPAEVGRIPTALQAIAGDYLQGAAPYGEQLMSLLDLAKLLHQDSLVVDETV